MIEFDVVLDLKQIGLIVEDTQKEISIIHNGITLTGHIDGIVHGIPDAEGTRHLLEIKSSNDKRFKLLKGKGYRKWDSKYYAQVQVYMSLLNLKRALVVVYNKDNSELYTERISFNADYTIDLLQRVFDVLSNDRKPGNVLCPDSDYYQAGWCCFRKHCFPGKIWT
jgi:hypothetical protein